MHFKYWGGDSKSSKDQRATSAKPFFPKGVPFWNKLPQLLNFARHARLLKHQARNTLAYEPIYLHVRPAETHPVYPGSELTQINPTPTTHSMTYENFLFLLDQVPAVRTIEFSGLRHDPLETPDLARFINYAAQFNGAETSVVTDGFLLNRCADELLESRLTTLVIKMGAHRPSFYAQLTQQPLVNFVKLLENVRLIVQKKRALKSGVIIDLTMVVDIHTVSFIPEMIRFAEEMGVDGLRFENYLSPEDGISLSDKTLYTDQKKIVQALQRISNTVVKNSKLDITMPPLLDRDMSRHRHCIEPYGMVSVDRAFNISGCSRFSFSETFWADQHQAPPENTTMEADNATSKAAKKAPFTGMAQDGRQKQIGLEKIGQDKIWEVNFFNSPMYRWLRNLHGSHLVGQVQNPVPLPCQSCSRNMSCKTSL